MGPGADPSDDHEPEPVEPDGPLLAHEAVDEESGEVFIDGDVLDERLDVLAGYHGEAAQHAAEMQFRQELHALEADFPELAEEARTPSC